MRNLPECFFLYVPPPIIDFKDSVQTSLVSVIDFIYYCSILSSFSIEDYGLKESTFELRYGKMLARFPVDFPATCYVVYILSRGDSYPCEVFIQPHFLQRIISKCPANSGPSAP